MAEIREYSYVEFEEKVLNPTAHSSSVHRSSVQLKASARVRLYRDMRYPCTFVAEVEGAEPIDMPWGKVRNARRAPAKVVPITGNDEPQAQRSSNPQAQQGQGNRR